VKVKGGMLGEEIYIIISNHICVLRENSCVHVRRAVEAGFVGETANYACMLVWIILKRM
jgi:hypothetical protein